jgi:membrane-bound metal-dependent hydrolase YbcI (DUF457 family)
LTHFYLAQGKKENFMPSPFAHITTGYLIYRAVKDKLPENTTRRLWLLPTNLLVFTGLSILPDIDTIPGLIFGDMHGFHNNYTHSLITGLFMALGIAALLSRFYKISFIRWFPAVLASYEIHILMDFFTSERGVKLFWPIYPERIIAPVKLFLGFQWGLGFFSIMHFWTLFTEVIFFLALLFLLDLSRKTSATRGSISGATGDD